MVVDYLRGPGPRAHPPSIKNPTLCYAAAARSEGQAPKGRGNDTSNKHVEAKPKGTQLSAHASSFHLCFLFFLGGRSEDARGTSNKFAARTPASPSVHTVRLVRQQYCLLRVHLVLPSEHGHTAAAWGILPQPQVAEHPDA